MVDIRTIESLTACCWSTIGSDRATVAEAHSVARHHHPGAAVLETCQRTEAYTIGPCVCPAPARCVGVEALRHIAEVAAGLHAVVLGEAQVLGQVRQAFQAGPQAARPIGDMALSVARRLRREVDFNSHAGALLDRAARMGGLPQGGRLLVLGAGQMGRLVATRATGRFDEVVVSSRRRPDWWEGAFTSLAHVSEAGPFAAVAGCLGSGAPELRREELPPAALYVDLGTPRNFASGLSGVTVTLADLMADEAARPHAAARRAELRDAVASLVDGRLRAASARPESPAAQLRSHAERVRQREAARTRRLHPELSPESVDAITRSLVNQLLHEPARRLHDAGDPAFAERVAALFSPA